MRGWLKTLWEIIQYIFTGDKGTLHNPIEPLEPPVLPPILPPVEPLSPKPTPMPETLLWDTVANIRHSVRVICDQEGLTVKQKNELCATVQAESGFKLTAKLENKKNGKTWSTDWGLAQINDHYHIGPGKSFPSVDFVLNNPEAVIRWMCKMWLQGHADWWVAWKSGAFRKYL